MLFYSKIKREQRAERGEVESGEMHDETHGCYNGKCKERASYDVVINNALTPCTEGMDYSMQSHVKALQQHQQQLLLLQQVFYWAQSICNVIADYCLPMMRCNICRFISEQEQQRQQIFQQQQQQQKQLRRQTKPNTQHVKQYQSMLPNKQPQKPLGKGPKKVKDKKDKQKQKNGWSSVPKSKGLVPTASRFSTGEPT